MRTERGIIFKVLGWMGRAALLLFALSVMGTVFYRFVPPPITFLMIERLWEGDGLKKSWRSLEEISPELQRAVIAAEDNSFCTHSGFDWQAIENALKRNQRSQQLRGASTISQQTAKNVFLWPQRDYIRKAIETYFTFLIELSWGKRRILEVYLNVVEWGDGIFGAEAAAQTYFHKSAKLLSAREAALLASILPDPKDWQLNGLYVRSRAVRIGRRMGDMYIPEKCGLGLVQ